MPSVLLCLVMAIAFINGANSNFKGLATVYGSGVLGYTATARIGALCIAIGGIASLVISQGLLTAFSPASFRALSHVDASIAAIAVSISAIVVVGAATLLRLPVSTTHALTGGTIGAALWFGGANTKALAPLASLIWPLLVTPVLAAALAAGLIRLSGASNRERLARLSGVDDHAGLRRNIHIASGVTVSLARAINDVPKFAGIILVGGLVDPAASILLVAMFMTIGSLVAGSGVAQTLSNRMAELRPVSAPIANFSAALMVAIASVAGLSVATTQISASAVAGYGAVVGSANYRVISSVAASWFIIVPAAIVIAVVLLAALR